MSDSVNTNESMIWCAKTGELQSLKTLLKEVKFIGKEFIIYSLHDDSFQNPGKVNEQMNGRSLLHYAADAGNFDVLKELISHGANVNVRYSFSCHFLIEEKKTLLSSRVKINLI